VARGFSTKETLLGCCVLLIASGLVLVIGLAGRRRDADVGDSEHMRRIYVAMTIYEETYGDAAPPSLVALKPYVSDPGVFLSNRDPYAATVAPQYPVDAGLPAGIRSSPFRISYDYAWNYPGVAVTTTQWLLADEWASSVTATGDFRAQVGGPVLRMNMYGALAKSPDRPITNLGDFRFLFGK
jgi:hypothetical protein